MEPSYCGRRGADEQIVAPDIAFILGISRPIGWKSSLCREDYHEMLQQSGRLADYVFDP